MYLQGSLENTIQISVGYTEQVRLQPVNAVVLQDAVLITGDSSSCPRQYCLRCPFILVQMVHPVSPKSTLLHSLSTKQTPSLWSHSGLWIGNGGLHTVGIPGAIHPSNIHPFINLVSRFLVERVLSEEW
jgi:hypothetical protein